MKNWLENDGAPFVIMEKANFKRWDLINDYEKICSVKDYIGTIELQNINILVLGDESMPIKIIYKDNAIFIVRWLYAPNKKKVENVIKTINHMTLPIIENFTMNWKSAELILFDSIKSGDEIKNNYIEIKLQNKNCNIKTFEYKKSDISLIIHKIE